MNDIRLRLLPVNAAFVVRS